MTRDTSHRAFRRLRDCTGSSLLEAAIVTPLLLLLTFSIADFGCLFYVHLALENGVSQATRYAVTGNVMADPAHAGSTLSRVESIKTAMREATPTLTIDDAAFTFSHRPLLGATWLPGSGAPNEIERVTVDYTWKFVDPLMWAFFDQGQIKLTVDSAMKNESKFE